MNTLSFTTVQLLLILAHHHTSAFHISVGPSIVTDRPSFEKSKYSHSSISKSYHRSQATKLYYLTNPQALPNSSDPYVILNLCPKSADLADIKKAYRQMALIYHPDARTCSSEEERKVINADFARINAAYAYLSGKSNDLPEPTPQELYIQQQQQQIQQQLQRNPQWNHRGVYQQNGTFQHPSRGGVYHPNPHAEGGHHVLEFDMNGNPIKRQSYRNSYNSHRDPYSNRQDDPTCPSSENPKSHHYHEPAQHYPPDTDFSFHEDVDRSMTPFLEGDLVRITQGSYAGFAGRIVSVYRTVVSQNSRGHPVAAPTMIKVEISPGVNIFAETAHAQRDGEAASTGPNGEPFDSSDNSSFIKGSVVRIVKGSWKGRVGKVMTSYPDMLKVELSPTMSIFVQIDYVVRDTLEAYEAAINSTTISDLPAGGETDEEIFGYTADTDSSFHTMFVDTTKKDGAKKTSCKNEMSSSHSIVGELSPEDETLGEYFGYHTSGNEAAFTKGEHVKIIKGPYAGRRGKVMTAYPDMLKIELSYTMSIFVEMKYVTKKVDDETEAIETETEAEKL